MPAHWLNLRGAEVIGTQEFLDTQDLLDDAADASAIALVIGNGGLGKSFAVSHWLEDPSVPSWRLEPTAAATPRRLIADCVKVVSGVAGEPPGTQYTLTGDLVAELSGKQALLIIDEAQLLTQGTLKTLRGLWLRADLSLAIVFVGGPEFEEMLDTEPMLKDRSTGIVRFEPFTEADVVGILPGYHTIYESAAPGLLLHINTRYANGKFRLWANFTRHADKECRREGCKTLTKDIAASVLHRVTGERP